MLLPMRLPSCFAALPTSSMMMAFSSFAQRFGISPAFSTARARNRRFWLLSAPRAHTKAAYKIDLLGRTLRALNRPRGPGQLLMSSTKDSDWICVSLNREAEMRWDEVTR